MTKDEIIQKYWMRYIKYWATNVREITDPPTEDGFWLWFALKVFDRDTPDEDLPVVD